MKPFRKNPHLLSVLVITGLGFSSSVLAMPFCKNNSYRHGPDPYLMNHMYFSRGYAPAGYGYNVGQPYMSYPQPTAVSAPAPGNRVNQPVPRGQGGAY
jgi:hypothetical protein